MITVKLEQQQWNQIMEVLARSTGFPYVVIAPLIQAIGSQLQEQQPPPARPAQPAINGEARSMGDSNG